MTKTEAPPRTLEDATPAANRQRRRRILWQLFWVLLSTSIFLNLLFTWQWMAHSSSSTAETPQKEYSKMTPAQRLREFKKALHKQARERKRQQPQQQQQRPVDDEEAESIQPFSHFSNRSKSVSSRKSLQRIRRHARSSGSSNRKQQSESMNDNKQQASSASSAKTRSAAAAGAAFSIDSRYNKTSTTNHSSSIAVNPSQSFGACLLVMDENHRLSEWLAFHYYMLPLRRVVILVDPRSQTSPLHIVERWRPYMDVLLWSDADIGLKLQQARNDSVGWIRLHRSRQKWFYHKCLLHLREQYHHEWVTFHDVDEYLYLEPGIVPNAVTRMHQPGSVLTFLNDLQQMELKEFRQVAAVADASNPASPLGRLEQQHSKLLFHNNSNTNNKSSSAADIYQQAMKDAEVGLAKMQRLFGDPHQKNFTDVKSRALRLMSVWKGAQVQGCIVASRTLFGALESTPEQVQQHVPSPLKGRDFETLQWHYRTSHKDLINNGRGKSIIQVSKPKEIVFYPKGPHTILQECASSTHYSNSALHIRHYIGSWQVYSSRVDARTGTSSRTRQTYEYKSQFMGRHQGHDNAIQHWLGNFCRQVTLPVCTDLLQGAGQVVVPTGSSGNTSESPLWNMGAAQMKEIIKSDIWKAVPNSIPFGDWLQRHYKFETLPNGTEVPVRQPYNGTSGPFGRDEKPKRTNSGKAK